MPLNGRITQETIFNTIYPLCDKNRSWAKIEFHNNWNYWKQLETGRIYETKQKKPSRTPGSRKHNKSKFWNAQKQHNKSKLPLWISIQQDNTHKPDNKPDTMDNKSTKQKNQKPKAKQQSKGNHKGNK